MNSVALTSLEARWQLVEDRESADCLVFRCPSCRGKASHLVLVATRHPAIVPGSPVWRVDGSRDLAKLTLRPTINLTVPVPASDGTVVESRCRFHGRIRNGRVEWSDTVPPRRRWPGRHDRPVTIASPE